jgi:hypothetical protein
MQPWRRVIAVLRRMGHSHSAAQLAMQRERWLRRIGHVGQTTPGLLRWLPRLGHFLFGLLAGYGLRPHRLIGWAVGVWLASAAVFWLASEEGLMAPTHPQVYGDARLQSCRTPKPHWTGCAAVPPEYPRFEPLGYSLDLLVPLLDLQQERTWAPMTATASALPGAGDAVRWLGWLEALFGWMALLLGAVSLGGWADRDRRD